MMTTKGAKKWVTKRQQFLSFLFLPPCENLIWKWSLLCSGLHHTEQFSIQITLSWSCEITVNLLFLIYKNGNIVQSKLTTKKKSHHWNVRFWRQAWQLFPTPQVLHTVGAQTYLWNEWYLLIKMSQIKVRPFTYRDVGEVNLNKGVWQPLTLLMASLLKRYFEKDFTKNINKIYTYHF